MRPDKGDALTALQTFLSDRFGVSIVEKHVPMQLGLFITSGINLL